MKVLITGGTGLLGKGLIETNNGRDIESLYLGSYSMEDSANVTYHKADICDRDTMHAIFRKTKPKVVIHAAGIANVDYCENNYENAWNSNVRGTQIVLEACKEYAAKLVFISTNAVFDGTSAPYSENDTPLPVNKYGRMKLEGEKAVMKSGLKYIILRPILMYGWNSEHERTNMVTWLIGKLKSGERVNIVNDVYENPLFNISCAEIVWSLIDSGSEGIYHAAGRDTVNRYDFAKKIADIFDLNGKLINSVSSDFFPGLAPRPRNTGYDTTKIQKLGLMPLGLEEGMLLMKNAVAGKQNYA